MFLNRLRFFALLAPFFAPFWSHFGSQVRHYTPFGRPGGSAVCGFSVCVCRLFFGVRCVCPGCQNGPFRDSPQREVHHFTALLGFAREGYYTYLLIAPALSCRYIAIHLHRCIDVSMYRYIAVCMYRCIDVSLYRYIGARYKVDTVWCRMQGGCPTRSTAGRVGGFKRRRRRRRRRCNLYLDVNVVVVAIDL